MFVHVGVILKDRPSLRFSVAGCSAVALLQYTRHSFGSKDSPTSASYALQQTATDNQSEFLEASESVRKNFYMDDCLESSQTVDHATLKTQVLVKLLTVGGFTLTNFMINVQSVSFHFQNGRKSPKTYIKALPSVADSLHVLGLMLNHRAYTLVVSRVTS